MSRVVARVNDVRNEWLFTEAWGVDVAVSTPRAMVAAIEGAIDIGHLVRLMGLRQGQASLAKLTLPEDNPLVGQRVRDVALAGEHRLAFVIRGSGIIVPQPDDVLEAGDEMLFFAGDAVENQAQSPCPRRHYTASRPMSFGRGSGQYRHDRFDPSVPAHSRRA